jgi:hypothetical protein
MTSKHIHNDEAEDIKADLIAECYIGFPKLLSEELMAFDIKDSLVFDTLMAANPTASLTAKKPNSSLEFTNLKDQTQN